MKASIFIQNLKSAGCAQKISTELSKLANISNLYIDVAESKVSFKYLDALDAITLKLKLKKLGYPSVETSNPHALKSELIVSCAISTL